jgi:hypothetical protein
VQCGSIRGRADATPAVTFTARRAAMAKRRKKAMAKKTAKKKRRL